MKKEISMLEEANKKKKGWSFVDDGSGTIVTNIPLKTKKALLKAKMEKAKKKGAK